MKENIESFFNDYAARFNEAVAGKETDASETARCFADYFVESSPAGVIGGKNDDSFKEKIPEGYAHYKDIGITAMNILSKEISIIDEFHAMAKIHWQSVYRKKDGKEGVIEFDVTYFLNTKDGVKIFAYVTGDEQAALKEHGLI